MDERIYESDLRLPALYLISLKNDNINANGATPKKHYCKPAKYTNKHTPTGLFMFSTRVAEFIQLKFNILPTGATFS